MQISPKDIIKRGILIPYGIYTLVQQNGIDCTISEDTVIPPKSFKNVLLNEIVNIPENVFAITNVRSSYSRKGVFISSGVYDSGYKGPTGCSIYNMSDNNIILPRYERILQMIFFEGTSGELYNGYYNKNQTIESKIK